MLCTINKTERLELAQAKQVEWLSCFSGNIWFLYFYGWLKFSWENPTLISCYKKSFSKCAYYEVIAWTCRWWDHDKNIHIYSTTYITWSSATTMFWGHLPLTSKIEVVFQSKEDRYCHPIFGHPLEKKEFPYFFWLG